MVTKFHKSDQIVDNCCLENVVVWQGKTRQASFSIPISALPILSEVNPKSACIRRQEQETWLYMIHMTVESGDSIINNNAHILHRYVTAQQ